MKLTDFFWRITIRCYKSNVRNKGKKLHIFVIDTENSIPNSKIGEKKQGYIAKLFEIITKYIENRIKEWDRKETKIIDGQSVLNSICPVIINKESEER